MKKFKRILFAVLAIIAAAVYFAEELSYILQDVEQEKKEMSKAVSKLQKEASKSARKVAEEAKEAAQEVGKQVKGKAQKKSGTKRDVPAQLEIPAMKGKTTSQIIEYTGHTLSYNSRTRLPNWVAYELTRKEAQGDNPRKDKFARCPQAQGPQADKEDYRNSGWDRGHMAPAGDMKWSTRAMDESYYFTNICPQNHELNTGDWKELEEKCRYWAEKFGSLHIVCGPIITDNTHGTLGENKVVIPDKFFKVLLTQKEGEWQGVGFIFHNPPKRDLRISTKPPVNRPLESYIVTIDEVEAMTGLDFFHKLPDSIENSVEQQNRLL